MTIRLNLQGRRVTIHSEEPLSGLKTAVPGAYESTGGYWTVPLSLESLKLLRIKYGGRLKPSTQLKRWARGVVESRQYMAGVASSDDAKLEVLPRVAPALAKAMKKRPYQRVGARFIADSHAALVADDPGLGKTLIAMGGILEAQIPGPYLVVAPKTAADSVWAREIERWLPSDHRAVTLPEGRSLREKRIRLTRYGDKTWLIVHPEIVMVQAWWVCGEMVERKNRKTGRTKTVRCGKSTVEGPHQQRTLDCGHIRDKRTERVVKPSYPKLFELEWGAVIVDESHESLIRRKGAPTQRRRGLDMLRTRDNGIRIAMSGTPCDSKPHQLWGTLNWLDPKQYSAFYRWVELYWQKGGYSGFQIGEFRKDREQLLWDSLSAVALRRTKAEVAKDLPPKMYVGTPLSPSDPDSPVGIWLPMDGKQARAYKEMEELSATSLKSGRLEAITALAELTRLKQLACAYGDIDAVPVKVNCYAEFKKHKQFRPGVRASEVICPDCKRHGWHEELKYNYRPAMPSNKFNWTVEALEEWGYPKDPLTKVVIVSFYTGILNMFRKGIEKHFKTKPDRPLCTAITGQTPPGKRRAVIDRFNQTDKASPRVMLLNVKAGGTAITLDTADRMIFISETRIPDQQKQAEDRIHRISNPRQCMYYYLRSLGTVDTGIALVNQEMDRETHRLLDQRRGVDYMRHVLDLSQPFS